MISCGSHVLLTPNPSCRIRLIRNPKRTPERGMKTIRPAALAAAALLLLCNLSLAIGEQLSTKECENLGFTGLALCSDCNSLAEFVKDEELVSDCRKCCSEDSNDSMNKITFSRAVLEVCMRKLVFYPEVVSFIEEEKDEFPALKVQYVYASPPKLIMLDKDGRQKETIRIDNWKREHIRSFLKEKVKPGSQGI